MAGGVDFGRYDIFRKIPRDLTKGTVSGAGISFFGIFFLTVLFIFELNSYLSGTVVTDVVMDTSVEGERLRVNFDVTLPNIPCQFASVDVQDVLRTRKHNITSNIEKWRIDYETGKKIAQASDKVASPRYGKATPGGSTGGRKSQELSGNADFETFVKGHDVALVNFYAPWCIWCKRLHPVWEDTAGRVSQKYMQKVQFAKMDCTNPENHATCKSNHITAFPTIITYRNHKDHSHEHYHGDRTVNAISSFVDEIWDAQVKKGQIPAIAAPPAKDSKDSGSGDGSGDGAAAGKGPTKGTYARKEGCRISGFLDLNKVPGSMFFTVESGGHSFDPARINMSHIVHQLSYGSVLTPTQLKRVPRDTARALNSLQDKGYFSTMLNASYEHYIKVVETTFNFGSGEVVDTYTYTTNSHQYKDDSQIAAAKFTYDLSPMAIVVSETRQPFYKFLTSVCAIIGGVFTVIGLIDSMVYHSLRTFKKKVELGKAG